MNVICLLASHCSLELLHCNLEFSHCNLDNGYTTIIADSEQEVLERIADCAPCVLLLHQDYVNQIFIESVKSMNKSCTVLMLSEHRTETVLFYSWQNLVDGVYFLYPQPEAPDGKASTGDLFQDILSGEYVNNLIYGHPERLCTLQPLFKLMRIDVIPNIVLTVILDHFWTVCEKKDNAYRYRLKRILLNSARKVLQGNMRGVASTLIGTDKVVILLDCENRNAPEAEAYAMRCAGEIQTAVQKRTGLSASVGVSNYCGNTELLWKAYEQSFRALENSFLMGNGQILCYRQPSPSSIDEPDKLIQEQIKKDFIIAISTRSKENTIHALNNLMAKLAVQNASESYTKSLIVIMLSEIARYCVLMGLDSLEISEKVIEIVNDIFKADTINDVKKEALSFLYFLLAKVKNDPSGISILSIAGTYIRQYYMEPLTLREVAGLCGYSDAYFSRCFKEYFGINFVQYLMHVRVENAKKFLGESDLNFAAICEKTGFQSLSYFSTSFKKEVGMTPQQFRLEALKKI